MGLVWKVPLQASKKMGEKEKRETKPNPRAPTGFLGLHSCWDAMGCSSRELNQRIQNFLLPKKIKGLCRAQNLTDSQPHPREHGTQQHTELQVLNSHWTPNLSVSASDLQICLSVGKLL